MRSKIMNDNIKNIFKSIKIRFFKKWKNTVKS